MKKKHARSRSKGEKVRTIDGKLRKKRAGANRQREPIPPATVTALLAACARRCCVCYNLFNDFGVKAGQIAHLNKDRSNGNLSNLVWLCLQHHNEFDSIQSQAKGLTEDEVKYYRARLEMIVKTWKVLGLLLHRESYNQSQAMEMWEHTFRITKALSANGTGEPMRGL